MSENTNNGSNFIGYEYRDITIDRNIEAMYADGYQNFGWMLDNTSTPHAGLNSNTMRFKRDRKIRNKAELTRLQRQFDACANEITSMEKSKAASASIVAFSVGTDRNRFYGGVYVRFSWRFDCSLRHFSNTRIFRLDPSVLLV